MKYLQLSQHQVYYFRTKIPRPLSLLAYNKVIRLSLLTKEKKQALELCQISTTLFKCGIRQIESKIMSNTSKASDEIRQLIDSEVISLLNQIKDTVTNYQNRVELVINRLAKEDLVLGGNISKLIEQYFEIKKKEQAWTPKTNIEMIYIFELLIKILGDTNYREISLEHARKFTSILQKLPSNMDKKKAYRGKSIKQILDMNPQDVVSVATYNKIVSSISTFFKWASQQGYVNKNYFEGFNLKKTKRAIQERSPFSQQDLQQLFVESELYTQNKFNHSYQYWVPLILLLTGARRNEICSLYLEDIKQLKGIWVIDINDNYEDKRLKTESAKRIIPIHSQLIELGFLDYVESLKKKREKRLFPELKYGRDGYGGQVSKWFNRTYLKQCQVKTPDTSLHSFRHNVADLLKQKLVNRELTAALLGHSDNSMTYGRYGDKHRYELLVGVVGALDFGIK